jgi:hypothetical protein
MNVAGIARARACFENAIEVPSVIVSESRHKALHEYSRGSLPQMPQMPQPHAPARRAMADEEDAFEERAASLLRQKILVVAVLFAHWERH